VAYVPLERIPEYEALGWRVNATALSGTSHGQYSAIGEYVSDRDEEPPTPNLSVLR
jgi:hypothetical protein